jgi:hypothetical protein
VGSTDDEDLRDPATIRSRCRLITDAVDRGESRHFLPVQRARLDAVAERVATLTRRRFPDLRIPLHSRWRHFDAAAVTALDAQLARRTPADAARARIDLTVVSVLLDAGAGGDWRYTTAAGRAVARSEGLGIASFDAFVAGRFSGTPGDPLRVDSEALARTDAALLRELFQVHAGNPLVGLEGRAALLARLGRALGARRPAMLYDHVRGGTSAAALLTQVLALTADAFGAPDVWPHPAAGVVPFHKLSQWLAYSLVEPLQWAGVAVNELDALTGLPEYRNGGLLLDAGVLCPRDAHLLQQVLHPGDEAVIEWRALTVTLLDELAPRVRALLGLDETQLPLAAMLEGGTWAAGREVAAERRAGGAPPLTIASDGTVF